MISLLTGILLQDGKYKIEKVLGQGGFGITYLAEHMLLGKKVAIKEFFYKDYCNRDETTSHITLGTQSNAEMVDRFLQKFVKEAKTISKFHHPNIVEIYDIFNENNTAYYVMEYIEGASLDELVKQQGKIPEHIAVYYIKKVADALKCVHCNYINHLDVKPSNIMLRKSDNQIILIDFGTSKQYDVETNFAATTTTPVGISAGFAPIEQYRKGGVSKFSPETDIYALGATLYKLTTGVTPPESIALEDDELTGAELIPPRLRNVILQCMKVKRCERPHSIDEFIALIDNQDNDNTHVFVTDEKSTDGEVDTIEDEQRGSKKRFLVIALSIVLIVIGLFLYIGHSKENSNNLKNDTTAIVEPDNQDSLKLRPEQATVNEGKSLRQEKSKTSPTEDSQKKEDTPKEDKAQMLKAALERGDYVTVQRLANQSYAPAYIPLAKYYLNNNEYDDAERYAKKAKSTGQSGAQSIITTLDNLGYYD